MPSRFTGLRPETLTRSPLVILDAYDDYPYDPAYIPPVSLQACTRPPKGN